MGTWSLSYWATEEAKNIQFLKVLQHLWHVIQSFFSSSLFIHLSLSFSFCWFLLTSSAEQLIGNVRSFIFSANLCRIGIWGWIQQLVKNLSASAGDVRDAGLIPGSGRSPGGGHDNPLQYSCLENYMDRGAWQVTVIQKPRVIQASQVTQVVKNLPASARDTKDVEFDSWVRKIP